MSLFAWLILFLGIGAIVACVALVMFLEDDTRPRR
jgi:hypothetical protein